MNKTEQQMLDNEEWTANLKFCVGDLSIPQWIGVLTLIEQKIRASNARTRLSVLEEVEGEMENMSKLLEISKCPDQDCDNKGTIAVRVSDEEWEPQPCQWCDEKNDCLSQITQTINELKLK